MPRRALWLLVAPLTLAASQSAHWAAYRLAVPGSDARAHLLASTGHGYLDQAPLLGGVAMALVLAALAMRAAAAARRPSLLPGVARWPFALVPPLAFAAQEHLERLLHDGTVPLHAYAERSFLLGLALQVPFGVVAYTLARLLLRAATGVGHALGRARHGAPAALAAVPVLRPAAAATGPRLSPLALDRAGRAPPARAAAAV